MAAVSRIRRRGRRCGPRVLPYVTGGLSQLSSADQHVQAFLEEARELLADVEGTALELESDPGNAELVGRLFRAMHTVKGSGAMFGFDAVAAFTHHVETALDRVRNGELSITQELTNLILASRDHIITLLEAGDAPGSGNAAAGDAIIAALQRIAGEQPPPQPVATSVAVPAGTPALETEESATYRVRLRLPRHAMQIGQDPLPLLRELGGLGEMRATAQLGELPALGELDPEELAIWWDIVLLTSRGENAIRDVFIFVEDESEIHIETIAAGDPEYIEERRLGEILIDRGDITEGRLTEVLSQHRKTGELLVEAGAVEPERVASALAEQQVIRKQREAAESASIRVAADKLDQLINLVGEMVTTQAQLSQIATRTGESELAVAVENMQRISAELRDCVLNVRMLPIGTTFSRFRRLVRDLSVELGKEVELQTEGGDTEVDKTVIERLNDPLVHLIRNCIDHAIEPPDIRAAAGKPRKGTVLLSAEHSGGEVVVRIQDDGAGIDPQRIARKAIERGVIASADNMSPAEILNLIFLPGFSTAEKVTDVSGRGVGMDVVRREIDRLRGSVSVRSELGEGTTVTIRLPLTLAIVEGLLTAVGSEYFVIQLGDVRECVELTAADVARSHGRHVTTVRDSIVPYVSLRELFHVAVEAPPIEQMVLVEVEGQQVGLVLDEVIGDVQAVIKPLGRVFAGCDAFVGSSILGDGTVALILDVSRLVQLARTEEDATPAGIAAHAPE